MSKKDSGDQSRFWIQDYYLMSATEIAGHMPPLRHSWRKRKCGTQNQTLVSLKVGDQLCHLNQVPDPWASMSSATTWKWMSSLYRTTVKDLTILITFVKFLAESLCSINVGLLFLHRRISGPEIWLPNVPGLWSCSDQWPPKMQI